MFSKSKADVSYKRENNWLVDGDRGLLLEAIAECPAGAGVRVVEDTKPESDYVLLQVYWGPGRYMYARREQFKIIHRRQF